MYDFYFGDRSKIDENPEEFLIFVKRLLPRWINGIPDSECLAIYKITLEISREVNEPVFIETGCGASTIAMVLNAALNGGQVFSWDINGSKGSFLRSVLTEAIGNSLGINVRDFWKFIGFDSTNKYAGIRVLGELGLQADFGFFDSWHTLVHLMAEVQALEGVAKPEFVIALDDAYYKARYENYAYLNMVRTKLGLQPVSEPIDNICDSFYVEIERYIGGRYRNVEKIQDIYKSTFEGDVFFDYYLEDRRAMQAVGMEKQENLVHRFDAWRVSHYQG